MKLQYLGTAAFEGIPAFFCKCPVCTEARKRGGRNIRSRSQAIVDDRLLIDFPADTYMHYIRHNVQLYDVKACIITHSHCDHLYPDDLLARCKGMSDITHDTPLTVYGGQASFDMVSTLLKSSGASPTDVCASLVKPFEPFVADGYTVTPLMACHAPHTTPFVYLIEKDGKTLFYSNDTDIYPDETWDYLEKYSKKIDLVSFDCTKGLEQPDYVAHLSFADCISIRERLCKIGLCDDNTRYVLTHFSHNTHGSLYDDMLSPAANAGFEVAYDGMIIEF